MGAGTAGLVCAAGAAGLGARVALIEQELMGGDCLNFGCVPSKSLIRSARVAASVQTAETFGVQVPTPWQVDFEKTMERMRRLRAGISHHDSASRFSELGVDVYFGRGSFTGNGSVAVASQDGAHRQLAFKKAVIATGARPSQPDIPGIEKVDYLTNHSLFSLKEMPKTFGIVGAGPVGCEMAQTFSRFGSNVLLLDQADRILSHEDPKASQVLQQQFQHEGIQLILNAQNLHITGANDNRVRISVEQDNQLAHHVVDQLLVATGRKANVEDLNLQAANVAWTPQGVTVNDHLQTTNPRIFAAGDVSSRFKFTHAADFQARVVIQNALFALGPLGRKSVRNAIIPWAIYTSPEVAHVGYHQHDAIQAGIPTDTWEQSFAGVDRAILDGCEEGFVRIHTQRGTDKILGATIVGPHASEMISEITLAMTRRIGLSHIASTIHPYPTQADAIRKIGDQFNKTRLTARNRRILAFLRWINVGR